MYKCKFCDKFVNAKQYLRTQIWSENGKKVLVDKRQCLVSGNTVTGEDGCDKLVLPNSIWCPKNEQWLHPKACVQRHINRNDGCTRCKQGKELLALMRRLGTRKREVETKLKIRKRINVS